MRLRDPDAPCPYEECDGDGMSVDEATNTAAPCRCRPDRIALRRKRRMERELRRSVPDRYADLGFDRDPLREIASYHPHAARRVEDYVRHLPANVQSGTGLWLYGNTGTGKTTLAYYVSAVAARGGFSVLSWNTITLLNDLRDSFDEGRRRRPTSEIVDAACSVDLLQLDDVSAARTTEWVLEQLYLIVNRRYEERRPIVFTSDLAEDEDPNPARLADVVGVRTLSRLLEMCGDPLVMQGEDMRRSAPAAEPARAAAAPGGDPQGWLHTSLR